MPQALAIPLAAATGLSIGTATTIASIGLYAATTALSTFIQMANQPKPDIGTKLHAASGGAVAQSMIVGEKESAGSLIYAWSWGRSGKTPNAYYTRVYVLQDLPSEGIKNPVWIADKDETIDFGIVNYTDVDTDYPADGSGYSGGGQRMGHPVTSLDHDGNHYFWVDILDGTQTAASPYLLAKFGLLADRPWTSDMIGRGRTLMIVTQRYTVKQPDEVMSVAAVVMGIKTYDWRKDSTNGGSGGHRWGDYSTYEYEPGNPVRIAYNIMRGISWDGKHLYGGQNWPARRFDHDTWTAAANNNDETVTLAGGGAEKRARVGAEIAFSEEPLTVIDRLLASCNGRLVQVGGIYKIYCGGIGATVYSVTDDDVIVTEPMSGKMFPGREEICNTITGTYVEPANGGQTKAYKKRSNPDYVAADDGEERPKEVNYDYVRSNTQAQRLSKHALNDNRRFMVKTVALPSIARKLEPVDVISWTSEEFGFENKKFPAGDITLLDSGIVVAVLREADATDADWSVSDEDPYTVGIYGSVVPDTQTISITVEEFGKKNDAGTKKIPALRILWDAADPDMVDCKRVRARAWRVADPDADIDAQKMVDWDEGKIVLDNLVRNALYKVQARIVPYSDRDTEWCDPIEIRTGDYRVTDDDTDNTAPDALSAPTLSTITADIDKDGSIDSGLTIAIVPAVSGRAAKKYFYEIFRRRDDKGTDGNNVTGYTLCDSFTVKATSRTLKLNVNYFYKARVTPITANDVEGAPSPYTSVGMQPLQYLSSIPKPTLTVTPKPRGMYLKWSNWRNNTFLEAVIRRDGVEVMRIKAASWTDHEDLTVGTDYAYDVALVDKQDRSGATSDAVTKKFRGVIDDDTDNDRPNAPVLVSLTPFIRVAESGENILKVKAVWNAASGLSDKGSYLCFVDDGDSVEKYPADDGDTSVTFRARSAVAISVWVKSVKFNGKKSVASNTLNLNPSKKAVNADDALGLTVSAGIKENILQWTKAAQPDHKWTAVYRRTTSPVGNWALLDTIKGTRFTDKNLSPGVFYDYKIKHVDTNDVEGNESSTQSSAAARVVDADIDQTAPGAPGTPGLTQVTALIDKDGKLDNGLTVTFTAPGSGRTPKKYLVEVYRSLTIGTTNSLSGYTLFKDFTTHKLSTNFRCNSRYYHKAVVTPISPNDVLGTPSAATSVGIQPAAKSNAVSDVANYPDRSGLLMVSLLNMNLIGWGACTDPDYAYTEVYSGTTTTFGSATFLGRVSGMTFIDGLAQVDTTAVYYFLRHVDNVGNPGNVRISSLAYKGRYVDTLEIADNAIRERFGNTTNTTQSISSGATTTVESVFVSHGLGCNTVDVSFDFRNTSGGNRTCDVTIEDGSGTVYYTFQSVALIDNGHFGSTVTITSLSGTNTTFRLRITPTSAMTVNNTKFQCVTGRR